MKKLNEWCTNLVGWTLALFVGLMLISVGCGPPTGSSGETASQQESFNVSAQHSDKLTIRIRDTGYASRALIIDLQDSILTFTIGLWNTNSDSIFFSSIQQQESIVLNNSTIEKIALFTDTLKKALVTDDTRYLHSYVVEFYLNGRQEYYYHARGNDLEPTNKSSGLNELTDLLLASSPFNIKFCEEFFRRIDYPLCPHSREHPPR